MEVWHPSASHTKLCPFAHWESDIEPQATGAYCSCYINVVEPLSVTNALVGKESMELTLRHRWGGGKQHT